MHGLIISCTLVFLLAALGEKAIHLGVVVVVVYCIASMIRKVLKDTDGRLRKLDEETYDNREKIAEYQKGDKKFSRKDHEL